MPEADEDAALVERARGGDREAWAALCRRHAPRLAAYLGARLSRPAVVEKLVGDAVVSAWLTLGDLGDTHEFAAWFRRVGAGLAMKWRQENPEEKLKEPFPAERCASPDQADAMRRLQDALRRLPEPQRMALEQRFRGGLSGEALAEVLHLDPAAAEAQIERALADLDRELGA
jgi:RNA polymerase sigma-70 factor (ECF subfamily)